jgi:hypothetical protein
MNPPVALVALSLENRPLDQGSFAGAGHQALLDQSLLDPSGGLVGANQSFELI